MFFTYVLLRIQHVLPLNPQKLGPVRPDLAFNTAASFTTNTNWQSYGGESTMSYLSQMVALVMPQLHLAGDRHRDRGGAGARHRALIGLDDRELLARRRSARRSTSFCPRRSSTPCS